MADGANIIDEFVVAFGLDPESFDKGQKKVLDDLKKLKQQAGQNAKDLEQEGKRGAEYFAQMKKEALGLFATLVGANGIKNFAANTTNDFAAMGRAAERMGMSASKIAQFQNVIVRNGGSAASARAELEALQRQMTEWKLTGNTGNRGFFSMFGADPSDDPIKIMEKFAKWAQTVNPQTANVVGSAIGLDPETIDQLIKGQKAFSAEMERSRKLGVPTDDQIKKAQELQKAWFNLKQAVTGDAQALLEDLSPALVTILNAVAKGIEQFPQLTQAVIALGAAMVTLKGLKMGANLLGLLSGCGCGGMGAGGKAGKAAAEAGEAAVATEEAAAGAGAAGGAAGAAETAAAGGMTVGGMAAGAVGGGILLSLIPTGANKGEADALARSQALDLIKKREGFRSRAYVDSDGRYRVGYGSDTVTDANSGLVSQTSAKSQVTRADADADLSRRVAEFAKKARSQVGGAAWDKLDPKTKAALIDVAYNHGSLWKDVASAVQTGNRDQIASAIMSHQNANGGINRGRRLEEANMVRAAARAAQGPAAGSSTTTVTVGQVNVHTQATDAQGIARDASKALHQELASQMNTGLSY